MFRFVTKELRSNHDFNFFHSVLCFFVINRQFDMFNTNERANLYSVHRFRVFIHTKLFFASVYTILMRQIKWPFRFTF